MDMSGHSGAPWLDQPVMLHSSRADTCKLTAAQCEYRHGFWRYWYQADRVYGLGIVICMLAILLVCSIPHLLSTYGPASLASSSLLRKPKAYFRYLAYKPIRVPALRYSFHSAGVLFLGAIGFVFFFAMTLGPKPYYWPNSRTLSYGNSPPVATRTGWMALGLLPFVILLPTKANAISALTGVPHEKLQVFHHWTSYAMFVLALIHTFPFIVFHIWKGDMEKQWMTSVTYWTGVVALLAQTYLTVMSLAPIRNRFYEFFKATHFFIAVVFLVFFFIHCDFRLSSWDYFIATGALYMASLLYSTVRTHVFHGLYAASLEILPCGFLKITVPTLTTWRPGQHVFLRFLTPNIHVLTAHPFTICSMPHETERCGKMSEMVFYIKARGGITGNLAKLAKEQPGSSVKVLLEGPYGGLGASSLAKFQSMVVISGGSGGGFSLAIIEDALRQLRYTARGHKADMEKQSTQKLHVVFASRHPNIADWYAEEVKAILDLYSGTTDVSISIHVTNEFGSSSPASLASSKEVTNKAAANSEISTVQEPTGFVYQPGRPDLGSIIASLASEGTRKSIGIAVCGPESLLSDVREAAALAQKAVLKGNGGEVYLHSEHFAL